MDYSQKTADLIKRQCKNVERQDFVLQKKKGAELIMKTYDLFCLERPKEIIWCKDIFDNQFIDAAGSALSAWSARSAVSARSAWSAVSAWSALSAVSAGSALSALDYDFDYYIFEYEYCELLMQAKEAGVGYRIEYNDVLYLVPTPLVKIDKNNNYHSEEAPAIRWKGGAEFYYLSGVHFEKKLWEKIVKKKIKGKEIMSLENMEQRMAAIKSFGASNMIKELNAKLIDKQKTSTLYSVDDLFDQTEFFISYKCPSTGRFYTKFIDPEIAKRGNAEECRLWGMGLELKDADKILIET